jgi:hypothetical protein
VVVRAPAALLGQAGEERYVLAAMDVGLLDVDHDPETGGSTGMVVLAHVGLGRQLLVRDELG